jgi:hypothetical protein
MELINLNLNKKIYSKQAVLHAIADFQAIAKFSLQDKPKYWQVKIDLINQQFKNIIKEEFANYVLGLLA